jgi:hypothetical protein
MPQSVLLNEHPIPNEKEDLVHFLSGDLSISTSLGLLILRASLLKKLRNSSLQKRRKKPIVISTTGKKRKFLLKMVVMVHLSNMGNETST